MSKGVLRGRRDEIPMSLDIKEVLSHEKYNGLPTKIGRYKRKYFCLLKITLSKHISGWMRKNHLWLGRGVLVKVVSQVIPTYTNSLFQLPEDICNSIGSAINNY